MLPTLLRRLRTLLGLALLLAAGYPALASHLLGGEMTYRYLDANGPAAAPLRYEITVTIYQNCPYGSGTDVAPPNADAIVGIYDQTTGTKLNLTAVNYSLIQAGSLDILQTSLAGPSPNCLGPRLPGGCTTQSPTQPFSLQKFVAIVNLPVNLGGYYAVFSRAARNRDITNLATSNNDVELTLYATLSPPLRPNRSPVFSDTAVAIICLGDTTVQLNNAIDADGDRLVYSFGNPYRGGLANAFTPPPTSVPYYAGFGYSPTSPLGTGNGAYATINAATGVAKYKAGAAGKYVVAVDVREYRSVANGDGTTSSILIGITRRDLQLVVATCPPTLSPALSSPALQPRSYTVEAGATLTFPITATQPAGNSLLMTVNSSLLDGAGGIVSTFNGNPGTLSGNGLTGTATATGTGTVTGTFSYTPGCDAARATPYDVSVTVQDRACGGKTVADVFRITVVKPTGPTAITGDDIICAVPATRSYTATGGTAPNVTWTVTGGTIVGSVTANPVTVNWTSATGGTLTVQGVSQYNCRTDGTVSKSVSVVPGPALTVTGNLTICSGSSTTINVSGSGNTYTVTGGPVSGTGSVFVLTPTTTTTYTVTSTTVVNGCNSSAQVTVTVNPTPAANVGPTPRSTCSGVPITLGAAPVTGNTYLWTPATGLSSATVANPTLTLTNTTGAPITQVYTLTETAGPCTATNSVTVTVNPAVVAVPGNAITVCSGVTGQLGAAPVAGLTYLWSPATGLSSATVANPTVTLTNTTNAPITQTYTLTVTDPTTTCFSTATVTVTVNPAVVANAGSPVTFCSGGSAQLGAAPVAGIAYQWSPATGLSSATVANPTVTLTNTTGAPITTTYTLTATNPTTGCFSTATVTVTVNPAIVANAGSPATFCSGGSAQLGAAPVAGLTYLWSPATGLSSATVANPTVTLTNTTNAPITTTYTLTVTDPATTCSGTATVTVTVNPAVVANAGPAVTFCSGSSAQLGVAPVAGITYQWSPATGLSSATVANPTVTLTNTTSAPIVITYTLTATDPATTCSSTATVVVTVNPAVVAVPGNAITVCSGVAGQLGAAPVTGFTYLWSPATGLSSATVANPTVTLTNTTNAATTQTYTLTTTNTATGCFGTATVVVTVNPAVVANAGTAATFCSGGSATLGAAPVTGFTYLWTPATGLNDATVANPTVTLTNTTNAPIVTTYTLTTTNTATGCFGTATVVVTVNPAVTANAGSPVTICSGNSATLGAAPVTGFTYLWTPATGLSSATVANPTVTLTNNTAAAITQTYTLTTTDAVTGCFGTATVVVTVNPAVVANAGTAATFCSGGSATLGAAPVAGFTYSWTPATGLSSATVANPTVTLTNTTNAPITTTYTLTVTNPVTTCFSTATVTVTVNPAVTANAGSAVSICSGASATIGAAPVAGFTYLWTPATGLSSATVANPTVTLTNTTAAPITQTYTLTTTDAVTGCFGTATVVVTVNPAVTADAGPAQAVCDNSTITLGTPALPGHTYSWSPATNLSSATVAQPVLTGVNTTNSPITQTYTLTATTAGNCTATSTVVVTINPRPVTPVIAGPASVCPTITGVAYNVVTPVTGVTYTWTVTGGTIAGGQGTAAITVDWGVAGTGTVAVFATNAQTCNSPATTLSVIINLVLQTPTPTGPTTVCQADGPFTYTTPAVNGSSYAWQLTGTAVGTLVNTGNTTTITFTQPGTALLVVTETSNPAGGICRGTSNPLTIIVNPSPATNLAITGPARFCTGAGAQTYTLAGTTGSTYVFTLNGAPLANTNGVATVPGNTAVGTYTLTARETNSFGCAGPLYTRTFIVDPVPGALTISGPRFVCPATRTLTFSVPNPTASSTYQWTVTNGTIASGQGTPTITVTFAAGLTANATVSVTESSQFGCGGQPASITVVPDNAQTPILALASVVPTDNNRIVLTFSVANTGNTPNQVQVQRRITGSTSAFVTIGTVAPSATTFTDASSGLNAAQNSYEYQLSLTNGCGDVFTTQSVATVLLRAVTVPGAPGTPRDQGGTNLTWTAYKGFTVASYQLYQQNGNGGYVLLTTVTGSTLQYAVPNRGQGFDQCFRIVAVAADGRQSNSNTTCVEFTNGLAFYNVITPNNDGLNDKLEILNVQLYPGNTMEIYNRWGRQVFSTKDYNNDTNYWGTDPAISAGVYYFLFKQANGSATKGWVEVIK